ncbi:hypothetical protein BCR33DRAFT_712577 [Rhizoclosmatium globosum]|uniref:Sodium/calcium exchanger membrane region domain-containing protein n=1 Tax=Rhizoclosmatium globosum TaxID=329046 RepID=A0A1Y2CWZ1_9FUNG|nr:hypothetical protein BCR33DRAFT_712577 [Rhizoclosmatium globosum]|eukprot:ORY51543.1 hypothetical protein BCR33DRAFT_712577 [Rhizoclosmatium globosum]
MFDALIEPVSKVQFGSLAVVFLGYVIPAAFQQSSNSENTSVLELSRGTAFMLLITYIGYLVLSSKRIQTALKDGITSAQILEKRKQQAIDDNEEEEEEVPITLAWVSLEGLSEQAHISKTFIGVILLPIVGNASEHLTAVSSAMRNKMDLVIAVAVGSSMQIALLVTPLLVLIGWMIGQPLTMDFQLFETAVLFVTIFVVSTLISVRWMLLTSYLIIAVAFYYVKD